MIKKGTLVQTCEPIDSGNQHIRKGTPGVVCWADHGRHVSKVALHMHGEVVVPLDTLAVVSNQDQLWSEPVS